MKHLMLYAHCKLVKGYMRCALYDLHYHKLYLFPKELSNSVCESNIVDKKYLMDNLDIKAGLLDKDLAFYIEEHEKKFFPALNNEWDFPSKLSKVIFIISKKYSVDFSKFIDVIDDALCYHVVLYFKNKMDLNCILDIIKNCNFENVQSIQIVLNFTISEDQKNQIVEISKTPYNIKDDFNLIRPQIKLLINQDVFFESQKYNVYFNRLVFIKKSKLDVIISEDFEFTIKDNDLIKKLTKKAKKLSIWGVTKDKIDVCKECEFRHMCIDNCLPKQRKDKTWLRSIECNYNPYISKWKEEEGYKTLEECGVICNESEFTIDHEKIAAINKELWEEE